MVGRSNKGLQLWLGVAVAHKAATVDAVTVEVSASMGGSKMALAKNEPL
jgi:hypothetical protein